MKQDNKIIEEAENRLIKLGMQIPEAELFIEEILKLQREEIKKMIDEADIGGYPTHRIRLILKQKLKELEDKI